MLPNLTPFASSITRGEALPSGFGEGGLAGNGRAIERRDGLFQILGLDSDKRVPMPHANVVGLLREQAVLLEDGLDVARPRAIAATDADIDLRDARSRAGISLFFPVVSGR